MKYKYENLVLLRIRILNNDFNSNINIKNTFYISYF